MTYFQIVFNVTTYNFCLFFCSHERVLEAITEEAERREIERFQPLIAGMNNHNIALRVKTYSVDTITLTIVNPTQNKVLCKRLN